MRRLGLIGITTLLLALSAAVALPDAGASGGYTRCRGTIGFLGEAGGGVFKGIQVRNVKCRTGRRVVSAYARHRQSAHNTTRVRVAGLHWACVVRFTPIPH